MQQPGLVLEGGAFRGIFTAGVLDFLLEKGVTFPYIIGASSGSGNAINFIAGQTGRTKQVIAGENAAPCFGIHQMHHTRKLLDLDKMLFEYAYEQFPFDFAKFFASPTRCEFPVTHCESGKTEYLTPASTEEGLLAACRATCSVPLLCKPTPVEGQLYMDGSIGDPVPFARAFAVGMEKVVVILTRKEGERPTDYSKMKMLLDICYRKHFPKLTEAMLARGEVYERQQKQLAQLEKRKKAWVLRPDLDSISHFENDRRKIEAFYRHGYDKMKASFDSFRRFSEEV